MRFKSESTLQAIYVCTHTYIIVNGDAIGPSQAGISDGSPPGTVHRGSLNFGRGAPVSPEDVPNNIICIDL